MCIYRRCAACSELRSVQFCFFVRVLSMTLKDSHSYVPRSAKWSNGRAVPLGIAVVAASASVAECIALAPDPQHQRQWCGAARQHLQCSQFLRQWQSTSRQYLPRPWRLHQPWTWCERLCGCTLRRCPACLWRLLRSCAQRQSQLWSTSRQHLPCPWHLNQPCTQHQRQW